MGAGLTEGLNDRSTDRPSGHFHLLPRMCIGVAIPPVPTRLHAVVLDEAVDHTVAYSAVHGASPAQQRTQRRYTSGNFSNSRVKRVSIYQALSSPSCTFSASQFQMKLWKVVFYFARRHKSNCLQNAMNYAIGKRLRRLRSQKLCDLYSPLGNAGTGHDEVTIKIGYDRQIR